MKEQIQAIVTILSLINPGVCVMMFTRGVSGQALPERMKSASKAILAIATILFISALLGTRLLHMFGVSLDAFMVAGGAVLAWMGFNMLAGKTTDSESSASDSLGPLILFAASPGTITGVITLSAAHARHALPVSTLIAIAVAAGVTWILLLLSARFAKVRSEASLLRDTLTRFMGLIVLAMGVQFALTGLHAFPGPADPGG